MRHREQGCTYQLSEGGTEDVLVKSAHHVCSLQHEDLTCCGSHYMCFASACAEGGTTAPALWWVVRTGQVTVQPGPHEAGTGTAPRSNPAGRAQEPTRNLPRPTTATRNLARGPELVSGKTSLQR